MVSRGQILDGAQILRKGRKVIKVSTENAGHQTQTLVETAETAGDKKWEPNYRNGPFLLRVFQVTVDAPIKM